DVSFRHRSAASGERRRAQRRRRMAAIGFGVDWRRGQNGGGLRPDGARRRRSRTAPKPARPPAGSAGGGAAGSPAAGGSQSPRAGNGRDGGRVSPTRARRGGLYDLAGGCEGRPVERRQRE